VGRWARRRRKAVVVEKKGQIFESFDAGLANCNASSNSYSRSRRTGSSAGWTDRCASV